jgi:hypothetical protein
MPKRYVFRQRLLFNLKIWMYFDYQVVDARDIFAARKNNILFG